MSYPLFAVYCSESADRTILDHDREWFEAHPDCFCRIRRALPAEFLGTGPVAVMRGPGVEGVRSPVKSFLADNSHRLDDGAFPYPVLTPLLVKEAGGVEQAMQHLSVRDVKRMFAAIGVPVEEFEYAFKREREAERCAKKWARL